MTDLQYRGQGLNRWIMEKILKEFKNKVDGIYLFGNDSVLNYYPKFGFKPSKEYEYYMYCNHNQNIYPYQIKKVNIMQNEQIERLAKSFGKNVEEIVLGYTPIQKEIFHVREHKEEDCTLFILGEDLQCIERNKMIFPVLSHA